MNKKRVFINFGLSAATIAIGSWLGGFLGGVLVGACLCTVIYYSIGLGYQCRALSRLQQELENDFLTEEIENNGTEDTESDQ